MPNVPNSATVVEACTRRIAAFARHTDPSTRIWVDGVQHTVAEVVAVYQRSLDASAALATKRAEVKAAMAERDRREEARAQVDRAIKPWVENRFGTGSKEALEIGFAPRRIGVKSVEVKQRAVERGKATREARHTMGTRQKLAIKGVLVERMAVPEAHGGPGGIEGEVYTVVRAAPA